MSETIYRKYRPKTFAEVTDQEHVKATIQNQLKAGTVSHAYLFTGPRGVGKTTIARLLAKAVNCLKLKDGEPCGGCVACEAITEGRTMDIMEIDAASNTGVDNVRENIIDAARFAPTQLKKKVFIIDEVHGLSINAFNALLKTLEEPPAHVVFILATTELHKVPETIVSRCQKFEFHRVKPGDIVDRLATIAKAEKVKIDADVLTAIAYRSEGCLRDAESLFGQILAITDGEKITLDVASLVLPLTNEKTLTALIIALAQKDGIESLKIVAEIAESGGRIDPLLDELIEMLRAQMITSLKGEPSHLPSDDARNLLELLLDNRKRFSNDRIPQLPLELLVVQWCGPKTAIVSNGICAVPAAAPALAPAPAPAPVPTAPGDRSDSTPVQKAAPSKESPPSSTSALSITLDDIKSKWRECCASIKERSGTLPVLLQDVELSSLDGDTLKLRARMSFVCDQLNENRNRVILLEVLQNLMQAPVKVHAEYVATDQDALVSDLLGEFGGRVVD